MKITLSYYSYEQINRILKQEEKEVKEYNQEPNHLIANSFRILFEICLIGIVLYTFSFALKYTIYIYNFIYEHFEKNLIHLISAFMVTMAIMGAIVVLLIFVANRISNVIFKLMVKHNLIKTNKYNHTGIRKIENLILISQKLIALSEREKESIACKKEDPILLLEYIAAGYKVSDKVWMGDGWMEKICKPNHLDFSVLDGEIKNIVEII